MKTGTKIALRTFGMSAFILVWWYGLEWLSYGQLNTNSIDSIIYLILTIFIGFAFMYRELYEEIYSDYGKALVELDDVYNIILDAEELDSKTCAKLMVLLGKKENV